MPALGKEWEEATHRALLDRNAELVLAIHRCLESAVEAGILEHDCFAVLQSVVHDGIPAPNRADELEAVLSRISAWTHEFGAALKPKGADTYGEGVRDCKAQVARIIATHRVCLPTPEGNG
jgi:hypothetical protein